MDEVHFINRKVWLENTSKHLLTHEEAKIYSISLISKPGIEIKTTDVKTKILISFIDVKTRSGQMVILFIDTKMLDGRYLIH